MTGILSFLGWALAALALLAFALNWTAVPAVLDTPLAALALAVAAMAFLMLSASLRRRLGLVRAALIAALIATAASSGYERFGARVESVAFRNGDVTLAGALYAPRWGGPHPAAVFVHGSGPLSRAEYAYHARRLARSGIAALVYDKRGVGGSGGALYAARYEDYAADAAAALAFLRGRAEVDAGRVGLIGYSEGEWTAPLAAVQDGRAAFVIVVGPSGTSPAGQVNAEIALRLRARGYGEQAIAQALALNARVFEYQRGAAAAEEVQAALDAARGEAWFLDAEDIPERLYPVADYAWWRGVMDFDPLPIWAQISAPVLLLKGARDDRSPADAARREIEAALARGGNARHAFVTFENADHALLEWPLGARTPPPLFAPGYFEAMIDWIERAPPVGER